MSFNLHQVRRHIGRLEHRLQSDLRDVRSLKFWLKELEKSIENEEFVDLRRFKEWLKGLKEAGHR